MANSTVRQSKWKPIVKPRRAKLKIYCQAPTHWLKVYEEAVIEFTDQRKANKPASFPRQGDHNFKASTNNRIID